MRDPTKKGKEDEDDARIDILRRRFFRRVAPDVNLVRMLVYAHPVEAHCRGEHQVVKVDEPECMRDAQVREDVLCGYLLSAAQRERGCGDAHQRLVSYRARGDARTGVRTEASGI